jgi:hypothetical protein
MKVGNLKHLVITTKSFNSIYKHDVSLLYITFTMQGTWNITLLYKDFMGLFGTKIKFYLFKILWMKCFVSRILDIALMFH